MERILVAGDVRGKVNVLFKRVEKILKKESFPILFCIGSFFSDSDNAVWHQYKLSGRKAPVPTYILGPNSSAEKLNFKGDELAPDIFFLGKTGIYTSSAGLKIAYLSGMESSDSKDTQFDAADIHKLCSICHCSENSFRGIDVLLVSPWPENLDSSFTPKKKSRMISYLIKKIKPRYVFCASEGKYFERRPFLNIFENGERPSICRVITLANVGSDDKWLYGVKVSTVSNDIMDTSYDTDIFRSVELTTKRKVPEMNEFFFAQSMDKKSKKQNAPKRQSISSSDCWFCLSSPKVEKHLIISIGDFTYLTLPKGGLVDYHLIICSVCHFQCSLDAPSDVLDEVTKFKQAVTNLFKKICASPLFFERNHKTVHMQINAVPIPVCNSKDTASIFQVYADKYGMEIEQGYPSSDLPKSERFPYIYVEPPSELPFHIKVTKQLPLHFIREVLADKALLNVPERILWEKCKGSESEEKKLATSMKIQFQPFDFTE